MSVAIETHTQRSARLLFSLKRKLMDAIIPWYPNATMTTYVRDEEEVVVAPCYRLTNYHGGHNGSFHSDCLRGV